MGDDELTPAEMSRLWAEALVREVNALAHTTNGLFKAVVNSEASNLPQIVRVSAARRSGPTLTVVVEEMQAFLSIDSAPGVFVTYEFEGAPADLGQGVESRQRGPEPGGTHALSEADLVEHVDAVMRFGFSLVRFPLFERLKIFGGNSGVALSWVNFDISWPPVLVRKWRP
ncbi:hypothetical protein [Amycolatopsis sp. CB00013]|uniref:hypothetical protein n=1 Tax=Amycolatopsis sp. CB00013 TaxID=1703945 RepID=UPI00093BE949|nr:hypothetical protein [Amycolatopsis sp. CB00013]OKJ95595.1 hypothetical protein AMK34_21415 [Amycolatopsis sp. CB00013]